MLRTVQTEGVRVRVTYKVKVMMVQSLHWGYVSSMLRVLRVHGRVREAGAARGAVPRREVSGGTLLVVHGLGGTVALVRGRVQLSQEVARFRNRTHMRTKHWIRDRARLGLQKSQDPCVFNVFGFSPVLRGQVVHQVLHTLVVAVVEVVCELGQKLTWNYAQKHNSLSVLEAIFLNVMRKIELKARRIEFNTWNDTK